MVRQATIRRHTKETEIELKLSLDGTGQAQVRSGVGFLDHMLELFARHGQLDLALQGSGDLHVDQHHTVEDVGICLGMALAEALGDKRGIARYGHCILPMDEALVTSAIDLGGRAYCVFQAAFPSAKIGDFDSELIREFWQAFAGNARCNLHIVLQHGMNSHHISEAIFKSVARALHMAVEIQPGCQDVPSTKGVL